MRASAGAAGRDGRGRLRGPRARHLPAAADGREASNDDARGDGDRGACGGDGRGRGRGGPPPNPPPKPPPGRVEAPPEKIFRPPSTVFVVVFFVFAVVDFVAASGLEGLEGLGFEVLAALDPEPSLLAAAPTAAKMRSAKPVLTRLAVSSAAVAAEPSGRFLWLIRDVAKVLDLTGLHVAGVQGVEVAAVGAGVDHRAFLAGRGAHEGLGRLGDDRGGGFGAETPAARGLHELEVGAARRAGDDDRGGRGDAGEDGGRAGGLVGVVVVVRRVSDDLESGGGG